MPRPNKLDKLEQIAEQGQRSAERNSEKRKVIDDALLQIDKDLGRGTIMRLGSKPIERVSVLPSGILPLDIALGVGGFPKGRIIEIYGAESSGKTTTTLHAIAEAQKLGKEVAFVDAEHAFDPTYAEAIGVVIEDLIFSQPNCGEEALEVVEKLVRAGVDLIIVDSVAALTPRAELEGDMGASHMGLQARLMSQALRKLTGIASKMGSTIIFINQTRSKIGVVYGNPETTTGGNALKFYASVRIEVKKRETIKGKDGELEGNGGIAKIVKNKVAPPFKTAEYSIIFGEGVSHESCVVEMGVESGIIEKAGAWFSYNGTQLGQGKENTRLWLKDNPDTCQELTNKIKRKMLPKKEEAMATE